LIALVQPHLQVLLQQRGKPDTRLIQQLGGDAGIEEVGCAEPILEIQQPEVIVGVVKNDLDVGVGQHRGQGGEAAYGQRVYYRGFPAGRELQEVDPVAIAVKTRRFGIDGEEWLVLESLEETFEVGLALNQADARVRAVNGLRGNAHAERLLGSLSRATGDSVRLGDQLQACGDLVERL
jgi:hypothetical protein